MPLDGEQGERASIVAWLKTERLRLSNATSVAFRDALQYAASAIEAGKDKEPRP